MPGRSPITKRFIAIPRVIVHGVVCIALLTGCAVDFQRQPDPPRLTRLQTPEPTTTTAPPPPRPRSIRLDQVDPCAIVAGARRAQLGFDRPLTAGVEAGFGDARTCHLRNSRSRVAARIALVTVQGMNVWLDETAQVDPARVVIAGYPALVIKPPTEDAPYCDVEVDTAPGQFLDVQYRDDGNDPPVALDQLCAGGRRVAEAAMAGLLGRR